MSDDPSAVLVPYHEVDRRIQGAYQAGLQRLRDLDALPEVWICTRCGATTRGENILISYIGDTPIPYCPSRGCPAHGADLEPAAA